MTKLRPLLAAALTALSMTALSGCAGTVIGAGTTAGTAAVEERGIEGALDDTKIRVQINDLWFRRDFEMYRKVGLNVYEGRVMLTGVVTTDDARADAVRLTNKRQIFWDRCALEPRATQPVDWPTPNAQR